MSALRQKMIEDLQIRNYSPHTIEAYVRSVANFYKRGREVREKCRVYALSAIMLYMAMETVTQNKQGTTRIIEDVIWIDPERQGGEPCFINTRVPIRNLFDYIKGGEPLEDFLEGFPPVTREQAEKVLELARASLFESLLHGENSPRS